MIMPSDEDYKDCKKIKLGKLKLKFPFNELATWINNKFNVNVLYIHEDKMIPDNEARLNIILEFEKDNLKFHYRNERLNGFIKKKQSEIASYYTKLLNQQHNKLSSSEDIFVTFSDFESVAKIEANNKIQEYEINKIKAYINNPDIWEISVMFSGATIFFFTENQKEKYEHEGKLKEYSLIYFKILKGKDEFNYFKESEFIIEFDSKENFDKNYNGNWFYYYR